MRCDNRQEVEPTTPPPFYRRRAELFHNSSITSSVSRDVAVFHQVQQGLMRVSPASIATTSCITSRIRPERTGTQTIKGFSAVATTRQRRLTEEFGGATRQPFQSGGTGSSIYEVDSHHLFDTLILFEFENRNRISRYPRQPILQPENWI